MSNEQNILSGIKTTCNFGSVDENTKVYDMKEEVGKKILDYRLVKIKCQLKSNESIKGIQFIYRNINTSKESTLINVKPKKTDLDLVDQEMEFKMEDIIDLRIWLSSEYKLIGFEVMTSKDRTYKFGYGNDDQLIKCADFDKKDNTIVGFGVGADDKNGVTSIFGYYLKKKSYAFYLYSGVISLRIKIKDEEFRKKMESKLLPAMSEQNKILYRVCSLPDNQFCNIIKYAFS